MAWATTEGQGFLARQINRWTAQWQASPEAQEPGGSDLDLLATRLIADLPISRSGPVVHGDYRLDNTMLDLSTPGRVAAVLDWELSTLGDPLTDVAMFCLYWQQSGDSESHSSALGHQSVTRLAGFPSRRELLDRYASRTGADLDALPWYVGFACFKLAVVAAGIAARARAGGMIGEGFVEMAAGIPLLVEVGHTAISHGLA